MDKATLAKACNPAVDTNVHKKVRGYIVDNFLLGADDDITDSTQLMESGVLDSTATMELVMFLEESFGIVIDDDEIIPENLNSIDNISAFVVARSN